MFAGRLPFHLNAPRDGMTHTPFARRRRKVSVLRQQVQQLKPILHPMQALFKDWKTSLAGFVGILAIVVTTWFPEYQVQLDKGVVVLMGLGLLSARDPKTNITGPPSYLQKMLVGILMLGCLSLCSCENGKFMGLTGDQWGNVAMTTGKELGKQLPGAAMQAYTSERLKPVTSAKQPVPAVNLAEADQAALLLPPVEASPSRSWLSSFFN